MPLRGFISVDVIKEIPANIFFEKIHEFYKNKEIKEKIQQRILEIEWIERNEKREVKEERKMLNLMIKGRIELIKNIISLII